MSSRGERRPVMPNRLANGNLLAQDGGVLGSA
jgi:hypothetical protein